MIATLTMSTKVKDEMFANGELRIQILPFDKNMEHISTIRGKHIYVVGMGADYSKFSLNDVIIHTFGILDACQRSGAKSITLIWLLFPYARIVKKDYLT